MAEDKDPFAEFGGSKVIEEKDPFAEFGGSKLRGKPLDIVLPTGTKTSKSGSLPFQSQVDTKAPSVLTEQGKVGYQQNLQQASRQKEILSGQLKSAQKAYVSAQGEGLAEEIASIPTTEQGQIAQAEKSYENIAPLLSGVQNVTSSFYKIPRYIYDVFAMPQNLAAEALNVPELKADYDQVSKGTYNPLGVLDRVGDYSSGKAKEWEDRQRKYDDDIVNQLSKGDFANAGLQIFDNVVASAPSIASMYLTGGAANAAKLGSLSKTLATALPFASAQNQQLANNENIPDWLKPVNSAFNAISEVIFEERFGTKAILDGLTKVAETQGKDIAIKSAKDFIYNYIKKALSKVQPVTDVLANSIEEGATRASQNIIAKITGEDSNRKIMDGVADATIVGGAQGLGASTLRKGFDLITDKKTKAKVDDLNKKREDLSNDLSNENLPDTVKEQIENKIESINEQINNELDVNRDKINNLPEETKVEVSQLSDKIESINEYLQDETISETTKSLLEDDLKIAQAELDAKFKVAKPTFDTEQQITEEAQQAEAEFNQTDDLVTYEQKMKELDDRANNLVPAPEEAEIGKPEVPALKDVESTTKALKDINFKDNKSLDKVFESISALGLKLEYNKDLILSKENEFDFGYDLQKYFGIRDNGYRKIGDAVIRIKDHTPNYNNFVDDVENGAKKIINVVYGDYNNTDRRKLKTDIDNFEERYPNIEIVDVKIETGDNLEYAIDIIKQDVLPEIAKEYHKGSDKRLVKAVENLLKPQEDAVQVETAGQVPVLTKAPVSEEVEQGKPEAKPEVITEEGVKAEEVTKADSFYNEAETVFPFDDIRGGYAVTNKEGKQIGRVKMSFVDDNTIKIDEVVSQNMGERTGNGSAIMKIVTDIADNNNTTLILTANLIGGIKAKGFENAEKLQAFYEKFGFVKDKKKPTMTRKPQPVLPQTIDEQIAELRIKEQVELRKYLKKYTFEEYLTDGKVDRDKITDAKDLKKFDKIYDKYDKLITPLLPKKEAPAPKQEAPAKAEPKLKSKVATRLLFKKAVDLFYDISAADGSAKKGRLARDRQKFLAQNPSIKYIDDNWPNISKQLKEKGLLEKSKGCP
jgi:hypothetical protein